MIKFENVSKRFPTGNYALTELSFEVGKGEFVYLIGPTGSGKTTVFKLLIREILPTNGRIIVDNLDVLKLSRGKLANYRKKIGVVFQDLKLLMDRTIFENIILPLDIAGVKSMEARKKVDEMMTKLGIFEHRNKFPIQLSGGELQRTAIARALILSPQILLADEPTGDLDMITSAGIVKQLFEINQAGTTIIMATHNLDIIKAHPKKIIALDKGRMVQKENDKKSQ